MTFWRPAYELRANHGYWFTSPRLMQTDMSQSAARAIYSVFNLVPQLIEPANDRDHLRW